MFRLDHIVTGLTIPQNVNVIKSVPLLDQAAVDAVRQWVYEPMVINGRPRGVIFVVTVTFKLK